MARPAGGYKNAAGKPIPGCTTITGRYKDSGGLINWAYKRGQEDGPGPFRLYESRDEAADIGTFVHEMIEADIQGLPLPFPQPEAAQKGFESYLEWKSGAHFTVVETEIPLVSELHQCGGTLDAVGYVTGKLSLIDWKTSRDFYPDQLIQLVFYMDLWEDTGHDRLHGVHILRLGKTGYNFTHTFYRRDDPKVQIARQLFAHYRAAFDLDKALK